ncbi:MAG: SGNH/GDSL hydrolase family protein [Flavobacteriales bacterium]|nr:SGNH/GDSL hydrolase family protein [Flavobacteriales bacterium]
MKKIFYFALIATLFTACRKSEFDAVDRSSGDADFSKYIALGNSLTQGFQDGGLYEDGQSMSYPSIIANQMKIVDPEMGDFRQPDVYGNGSGYMHLEWENDEIVVVRPADENGYSEDPSWENWGTKVPYNNLGIAGITLMQCVALDDNEMTVNQGILGGVSFPLLGDFPGNPFARFMDFGESPFTGGEAKQYLDHVKESNATFFTCWLGNNDVLGYATSGGVSTEIDLSLIGFGVIELNTLSDPTDFRMKYDSVLTALHDQGADGICATLPDVTVIPYFNTFTIQGLKDEYGYSDVWIEDYNGTVRVATDDDLIILNAKDTIELGAGSSEDQFLQNGLILDSYEVSLCQSRTMQLNSEIKASAASFNYPVVDMHGFLNTLKAGAVFEGVEINPEYISGGAFSLDGIHLNPRGYAIVANEFIEGINDHYNSNIPKVSIGNYRGVVFP